MTPPTTFTTNERFRVFDSEADLKECRLRAYNAFIKQHSYRKQKHLLTAEEDRLFVRYHEEVLIETYRRFDPSMSPKVMGTAFLIFKQFFLNATAMQFRPLDIVMASIYVACRIGGVTMPLHQFKLNFDDGERAVGVALTQQDAVLDKLGPGLHAYNPFKTAQNLYGDIKMHENMDISEFFWPRAKQFLHKSYLTDALLLHSPQKIALASNAEAASVSGVDIDRYISRVLCKKCPEEIPSAILATRDIRQLVSAFKPLHEHEIKPIRLKLNKIWASAPNFKGYERRIKKKIYALKAQKPWVLDETIKSPDEKYPRVIYKPRTEIYYDRRYL